MGRHVTSATPTCTPGAGELTGSGPYDCTYPYTGCTTAECAYYHLPGYTGTTLQQCIDYCDSDYRCYGGTFSASAGAAGDPSNCIVCLSQTPDAVVVDGPPYQDLLAYSMLSCPAKDAAYPH